MKTEITAFEMRRIDRNCEGIGLLPIQLMENAGAHVARVVRTRFDRGAIIVLAGTGNNGGDGFVAARHLLDYDPEILLLGRARDITTDEARQNWQILKNLGAKIREIRDSSELPDLDADVIIDAILGTGVQGRVREPAASAICLINDSDAFVLSVDVPSGFDPDCIEYSVHADLTVTFHRRKTGLFGHPGVTGEVEVAEIGIPARAERITGTGDLPPARSAGSHKGDSGRVLVVGGGAFTGAPALAALAALRTGADWVTVAAPRNAAQVIAGFSPNLIVHTLSDRYLAHDDTRAIGALVRRHDAVVIGMGLGRKSETAEAVLEIIRSNPDARFVIDADALHALEMPLPERVRSATPVITPHAGEFEQLGGTVAADLDERCELVMNFSARNRVVTLLKGEIDVISDGEDVRTNHTGNAGMTVGGTGDVLAGVVGSLLTKHDATAAATAGAFITGTAGDIAFRRFGYGLLATDVIECVPEAMWGV
ncbi:MAG TPA: NAD(P)H-hydrate dehydratase [Methanosarcinales archaeon]|nr:NAD(P)H-hydrate dehydratase [Methanosarcinales archaeon]